MCLTRSLSPLDARTELNQFQHSEVGELQGRDDYEDTRRVAELLRTQTELKHKMDDYVKEHHKETYMDSMWGRGSLW